MNKELTKQTITDIIEILTTDTHYDLSDVGNSIGIAIGKYISKDELGFEYDDLIDGIKHGISLIDGTHNEL
jgi:hypothetical protein